MLKLISSISIVFFIANGLFGQPQNVRIQGYAPAYAGKSIKFYEVEDYLSHKLALVAETNVLADSSFKIVFKTPITQKIIIKSENNSGFLYIQPHGDYDIYFPERDKFDPYKPSGNNVEISFFQLDSNDINYKILGFQRWVDNFIGNYYHLKSVNTTEFVEALDRFKTNVEKAYKEDTSTYLKTYVRFTVAGLDNIQQAAERNRYEKHDFYIKQTPVQYNNDAYMEYISAFYKEMIPRLPQQTNEQVYAGVLKSSPTMIMKALAGEYTLINLRIRELVMIKALSEVYYSGDYPQTNILTILDSVQSNSLFKANEVIAGNIKARLTELTPGVKAPDFVLMQKDKATKTLTNYSGRHLYLHFVDPNSDQNMKEVPLLQDLHKKYNEHIQFVTIYKEADSTKSDNIKIIENLYWDKYRISSSSSIWSNYKIETYPTYILIDAAGYIVAAPALKPTPNGQYETIDKTFFSIRKKYMQEENKH